jgi:hypothetical protein
MRSTQPPRIATWLLTWFVNECAADSMAGDLIERYRKGRTRRWYCCQIMHAILFNGGLMLKYVATVAVLSLFATMLMRMAHDGFFHPGDPMAKVGLISTIDCLVLLVLLALRAAWRLSTTILRRLFWPTVIATVILGLTGTTTIWNGVPDSYLIRTGVCIYAMCLLAAFSLWRTRKSVERV